MGSQQKKEEKCQFWKRLEIICRNSPTKKREKKRKFLKSLEIICRNSPTKKKERKCQFWKSLGRGYLSEQSHQKKGEKVSILEKFRKRLFVGTVPPKKKGEKV